MSKAIFLHPSDQILSAASLSLGTGTLAAGYGLTNLHGGNPANGIALTAATTFYLLMDFGGSTKAMKAFHFFNHNFDAGIVLVIQGNATNSWGAPTVNTTVTVPAATSDGRGQNFVWLSAAQTTALRWWRIGTTTTNSAVWKLGQLVATTKVDRYLPFDNYMPTLSMADVRVGGVEHLTPTGVSLRYQAPSRYERISGEIKGTRTQMLATRDWIRACGGKGTPTAFLLEDNDTNKETFFVVPESDTFDFQHAIGDIWRANLALRSLSNGVAI